MAQVKKWFSYKKNVYFRDGSGFFKMFSKTLRISLQIKHPLNYNPKSPLVYIFVEVLSKLLDIAKQSHWKLVGNICIVHQLKVLLKTLGAPLIFRLKINLRANSCRTYTIRKIFKILISLFLCYQSIKTIILLQKRNFFFASYSLNC